MNNNLLYVPDDFSSVSYTKSSLTTQSILEKGWQIEFRENNNQKALNYYQSALPEINSMQSRGEILNIVARLQKKLKLDNEAIGTYDLIWNEYPDVLIQNKIPLGAVALVEKSLLYLGKKDTVAALKTVHTLLNQIHKPRWEMGYSHLANFLSKVDEIVSLCENSHNEETKSTVERIGILKDSISFLKENTDYLLAFQQSGI